MTSIQPRSNDDARLRQTEALMARQQRSSQRLASGRRIASAADDPAGLAIARRLEAAERGLGQGEQNVASGRDVVRTADAALQTSQDTVARMRELAIQARSGVLADSDRQAIQQDFDQLAAQLDQIGSGTSYGGRPLLDGAAAGVDPVVVRDGAGGERELPLPDVRGDALSVSARDVTATDTPSTLDAASDALAVASTRLGAADSGLTRHSEQLARARVEAAAARSRSEDADVAKEVAEATRDRILLGLQQAGQRQTGGVERLLDRMG
jgi:flagellin